MRAWLIRLSSRTINTFFAIGLAVPFAMALIPPLYLWGSSWKSGAIVLGQPFSMWYWNLIALLTFFLMWALYGVQNVRGENEERVVPTDPDKRGS